VTGVGGGGSVGADVDAAEGVDGIGEDDAAAGGAAAAVLADEQAARASSPVTTGTMRIRFTPGLTHGKHERFAVDIRL
jgi:hypothetical protein